MIVARGWFGGNRLLQGTTFTLNVSPFNGAAYGAAFGQRRGRKIKYLYASNFSVPPGDDIYLPYVPIEPSQVATSLPDTFDFPLAASLQVLARSSDQVDASGDTHPATRTETLFTEELHPRLPLSKPVQTLAAALPTPRDLYDQRRVYYNLSYDFQGTFYEKVLPLTVQRKFRDPDGTLNYYRVNAALSTEQIEALRSKHATEYRRLEQGFRRRAAYWQERKIAALRGPQDLPPYQKGVPINYLRWDDRFLLAKLYQTAGDEVSMRRVLRQLTADTRNQPSVKGLYHQAEYMLRTGQYPTDAGYKGPS